MSWEGVLEGQHRHRYQLPNVQRWRQSRLVFPIMIVTVGWFMQEIGALETPWLGTDSGKKTGSQWSHLNIAVIIYLNCILDQMKFLNTLQRKFLIQHIRHRQPFTRKDWIPGEREWGRIWECSSIPSPALLTSGMSVGFTFVHLYLRIWTLHWLRFASLSIQI